MSGFLILLRISYLTFLVRNKALATRENGNGACTGQFGTCGRCDLVRNLQFIRGHFNADIVTWSHLGPRAKVHDVRVWPCRKCLIRAPLLFAIIF